MNSLAVELLNVLFDCKKQPFGQLINLEIDLLQRNNVCVNYRGLFFITGLLMTENHYDRKNYLKCFS
jgi:hypothetical protein